MQIKPENNVLLGYVSGLIAAVAVTYAKKWGYDVPDAVAVGLPGAIGVGIAHLYDVVTSARNKPVQQQCQQASMPPK